MNIDINSQPVRFRQFDPDAPDAADPAEQYLEDWIDSGLDVEEAYTAPIERMLDDDLSERLSVMLDHYRHGRGKALEMATESLMKRLEQEVKRDAA